MIQRVQSIYLLIVSILMIFMLVLPIAEIGGSQGEVVVFCNYNVKRYFAENSKILFSTFPVTILTCMISLVSFINIFFYPSRNLQMRICVFTVLLLMGLLLLIFYYYTLIHKELVITNHFFKIPILFPFINIILTLLAFKGIRRDELLVRSYERLRK